MHRTELQCDVLVAGGGMAGVTAATSAARLGARVILLEANSYVGGMATAAEVGTICGIYLRDSAGAPPRYVSNGFLREFSERLQVRTGVTPFLVQQGLWVLPCDAHAVAREADELLESCGIQLLLRATVFQVDVRESQCRGVRALAWNEVIAVQAKAMVDCTGEATLAHLAGCRTHDGLDEQAPALVFALEGVEGPLQPQQLLETRLCLRRAVEAGMLTPECERLAMVPGPANGQRLLLKLNLPVANKGAEACQQITAWECQGRRWVQALHAYLTANLDRFRRSRISSVASQVGVRSGRRIQGHAELSDADLLAAAKRPDGVARGAWPMERWTGGLRPDMAFFPEAEYYEISLSCLRTRELENLWAAGRCFSASSGAMTSARVIGTAMATGWAAGAAAALQARGQPPEDCVPLVRGQM